MTPITHGRVGMDDRQLELCQRALQAHRHGAGCPRERISGTPERLSDCQARLEFEPSGSGPLKVGQAGGKWSPFRL